MRRHFPEDDQTFYWRVLAGNAEGWSEGDHVEAFTSGTAEQAGRFAVPDEAEPFGPVAPLFSAAALEAIAEVLPGHQPRIEAALGDEHPEGIEAAEVFNVGLGLLVAAALIVGALLFILFAACYPSRHERHTVRPLLQRPHAHRRRPRWRQERLAR